MKKIYEELLRLPNLQVNNVLFTDKKIEIHCEVSEAGICPSCGCSNSKINQTYTRKVRDLDISGRQVWLHLLVKQHECDNCGRTHSQLFEFVEKGKSYTKRQAKWIFEMCKKQAHTEVGALLDVNAKTVENIFYAQAQACIDKVDWQKIRRIGIDEFAFKKGHKNYILILVDLDTHAIISLLPFRDKASIIRFFKEKGVDFCNQIEVYSSDMWQPFLDIAEEIFPNATTVIDRFHWTKHLNKAVDETRKELRRTDKENKVFKNLKWPLIKRQANLNEEEKQKVAQALEASLDLSKVYRLKNELVSIFDKDQNFQLAKLEVELWIKKAETIENKYLNKFIGLLRKNLTNIVNYFQDRVSNGVVEGSNNLLRTIKRFTFNMTNFENFKRRVFAWKT